MTHHDIIQDNRRCRADGDRRHIVRAGGNRAQAGHGRTRTDTLGAQVNRLAEAIATESEGRLRVEPYFNSQLGTENDTLAQLARGRIEMGLFTISAAGQHAPEVGLMQLYGYFDSNDQRACVQDNHLTDEIRARLNPKGVYFGTWAEVGNGYLMSDREITNVDDLKGLKVGISVNKINTEHWKAFGANPVPVSPGSGIGGIDRSDRRVSDRLYLLHPLGDEQDLPDRQRV